MASKKKDREARKKTKKIDFLEPVDLSKIGTEDDPCFGTQYDLSTAECKRCGDSELCAVVFAQNMTKQRTKIEKKKAFKDIQLEPVNEALLKWVTDKKSEGLSRANIISKAKKTFGSTRKEIKDIYKTLEA